MAAREGLVVGLEVAGMAAVGKGLEVVVKAKGTAVEARAKEAAVREQVGAV